MAAAGGETKGRGRWARWFVVLPFLHLGACVADLMSEQIALMAIFCVVTERAWLSILAHGVLLALLLSLPFGFFAIRFRRLRPFYFVLLASIPVVIVGLDAMVAARIFTCDGP